jgi:hypothetical protein
MAAVRHNIASCLAAALLLACAACSTDIRKFYVSTPSPDGILLARDLPELNALVAANPIPPSNVLRVPNGTKGLALKRKFLRGGRLVDPYSANTYDMERDGTVEVVLFELTDGPHRGSKGWVKASFLRPDFWYL